MSFFILSPDIDESYESWMIRIYLYLYLFSFLSGDKIKKDKGETLSL